MLHSPHKLVYALIDGFLIECGIKSPSIQFDHCVHRVQEVVLKNWGFAWYIEAFEVRVGKSSFLNRCGRWGEGSPRTRKFSIQNRSNRCVSGRSGALGCRVSDRFANCGITLCSVLRRLLCYYFFPVGKSVLELKIECM